MTKSSDGFVGYYLVNTALDQASLWAKDTWYDGLVAGLGIGGGVRYVGESFGDSANTILIPDYTLFDATISFDFKISAPRPQGMERSDQRDQSGEPLQLTVSVEVQIVKITKSTRARSSAANRDLVCHHISGVKPTQVCRATGPIFAAHPAYRFRHRHRLARIDDGTGIFKNILTT